MEECKNSFEDMGIKSIKIEGRMKKPEYVYSAVKYYKDLVNNDKADPDDLKKYLTGLY